MKRLIFFLVALLLSGALSAQNLSRCEYWFDQNYDNHQEVSLSNSTLQWQADASALSEGVHSLTLHIQDADGRWSSPQNFMFFHFPTIPSAEATYMYWFDDDANNHHEGTLVNGSMLLDASALSVGFHKITLLCFVETSMRVESHLFYKVAEEAVSTAITFHYRIDNGAFQTILNSANSSFISLDLDMSDLAAGVHTIDHFITNANNDILTALQTDTFEVASDSVGVDIYSKENILVYSHNGSIVVNSEQPQPIWIYDTQGKLIAFKPADDEVSPCSFSVPNGVYIVRTGKSCVRKVLVMD